MPRHYVHPWSAYDLAETLRDLLRIFELDGFAIARSGHRPKAWVRLRLPNPCPVDASWWIARAIGEAGWDGSPIGWPPDRQAFDLHPNTQL